MIVVTIPELKITREEAEQAYAEWGCNCGPSALAAILGLTLSDVCQAMKEVGFVERHYTNPTMMEKAITLAGGRIEKKKCIGVRSKRDFPQHGLARIQWTGPWTHPGANPKWAYRQTHWVASWRLDGWTLIFDVNCCFRSLLNWEKEIVPFLTGAIPRADGGWFITHSWEVV